MIYEVKKNDQLLMNQLITTFNNYFKDDNYLKNDFEVNPFSKYYVYCENDDIIAFINYYDLYDRFEISYIEVLNKYRNKNIASKLMENLIILGEKNKIKNITLEVNITNDIAIKLYKKYDFEVIATRKRYYNGIDAFLMERKMM